MILTSHSARRALVVPAALLLASCATSHATGASVAATPRSPAATPSPTASLPAALSAADIVDSGDFKQSSDSLLGGLANTDARVFASADGSLVVEVDLVTDVDPSGAVSDYAPYQSAAANQAGTHPVTASPGLGQRSDEYAGVNGAGKSVVSISFVEGRYIAVVTAVGTSSVTPDAVKVSAESIAQAQDNKINSLGS